MSVYRTIGPLVFAITAAGVVPCGGPKKSLPIHNPFGPWVFTALKGSVLFLISLTVVVLMNFLVHYRQNGNLVQDE